MVTLLSEDERERITVDAEAARDADRFILADEDGKEYHFGRGPFTGPGIFTHVATYTDAGRERYAFWHDVMDGIEVGCGVREEPELGPRVSPLAEAALEDLALLCNHVNGFYGDPEKSWAVRTLRALYGEEHFDPDEIYVWAATHGWGVKHGKVLRDMAQGVREGKQFRDYARRAIRRDREQEARMVAAWRGQGGEQS